VFCLLIVNKYGFFKKAAKSLQNLHSKQGRFEGFDYRHQPGFEAFPGEGGRGPGRA